MPNENDRRTFTIEDAKNIPLDVLKNSYFFLDQDLTLRRLTTETRPGNGDMKGAVNTHTVEDVVVISHDTKGKLLELYDEEPGRDIVAKYEAKVQFDTDESCFLNFYSLKCSYAKDDSECAFKISTKSDGIHTSMLTVTYNGNFYFADDIVIGENMHELEFQLRETTETVTTKAKGAW